MPQSLTQIYLHVVFSTKDRRPYLRDGRLRERLHAYLAGIFNNQGCPAMMVGGAEDHVHALCRLGKNIAVATLLRELKRDASKWIKEQEPRLGQFHWQAGYGAEKK